LLGMREGSRGADWKGGVDRAAISVQAPRGCFVGWPKSILLRKPHAIQ
jgi:hypothetical protein